jgi:uncharacterized repeat protein (TIGR04076 family)
MREPSELFDAIQTILNYNDEEMDVFKANPRNLQILSESRLLRLYTFTAEVVDAHGCACQHRVGQKIVINGNGSIASEKCPEAMCIYLLQALVPVVFGAQEFLYADMDPNRLKFKRVGCFDIGLRCGGLGHVTVEFSSQEHDE